MTQPPQWHEFTTSDRDYDQLTSHQYTKVSVQEQKTLYYEYTNTGNYNDQRPARFSLKTESFSMEEYNIAYTLLTSAGKPQFNTVIHLIQK